MDPVNCVIMHMLFPPSCSWQNISSDLHLGALFSDCRLGRGLPFLSFTFLRILRTLGLAFFFFFKKKSLEPLGDP